MLSERVSFGRFSYGHEKGEEMLQHILTKEISDCVEKEKEICGRGGERTLDERDEWMDWEKIKGRVYPMMVRRRANGELLSRFVYRKYLDLAVIYYIPVGTEEQDGWVIVDRQLFRKWDVREEEVYLQSVQNMEQDGYQLITIWEILREVSGIETEREGTESLIYVMTNERKIYGAAGILSEKILRSFADRVGSNYYLLPSSIHEMMVVPERPGITGRELSEMVRQVNEEQVRAEEQLSTTVYYYNREEDKVRIEYMGE